MKRNNTAMGHDGMLLLKEMHMAPYIQLATSLIGKTRISGGNMFRHQIDTFGILVDYGYIDAILLKASVIHDLIEDSPDFERDRILNVDEDGAEVLKLVLEVTKRPIETKAEFLERILDFGSDAAKILKSADRISNMISLGFVTNLSFVQRYIDETEAHVLEIARRIDERMYTELKELIHARREIFSQLMLGNYL